MEEIGFASSLRDDVKRNTFGHRAGSAPCAGSRSNVDQRSGVRFATCRGRLGFLRVSRSQGGWAAVCGGRAGAGRGGGGFGIGSAGGTRRTMGAGAARAGGAGGGGGGGWGVAGGSKIFSGRSDERLQLTGITGTNGKTTTSYLIDSVLRASGHTTALLGTIEYHLAGRVLKAVNTTPESLDLVRLFAELESAGGSYVTMEVSSHALALRRVHGLRFHTAVFTNLTRDHLDYHGSMEQYFAAKQMIAREIREH